MKVTGWTDWYNPRYFDVAEKLIELKGAAIRDIEPKIPTIEEAKLLSEEGLKELWKERHKAMDKALNTDEINELTCLLNKLYDTVLEDVRNNGYHFTGCDHQDADWGVPIIDDKYLFTISQRQWGELIAQAFPDEIDNSKGLGYCEWAWIAHDKTKVKIPDESLWVE